MAKEYSKTKGPGTQAKPDQHQFFRRLATLIKRTLEKCERENGMIYHQKVPYDPPELVLSDKTFGLVSSILLQNELEIAKNALILQLMWWPLLSSHPVTMILQNKNDFAVWKLSLPM